MIKLSISASLPLCTSQYGDFTRRCGQTVTACFQYGKVLLLKLKVVLEVERWKSNIKPAFGGWLGFLSFPHAHNNSWRTVTLEAGLGFSGHL